MFDLYTCGNGLLVSTPEWEGQQAEQPRFLVKKEFQVFNIGMSVFPADVDCIRFDTFMAAECNEQSDG
jgi:hypothetical protein